MGKTLVPPNPTGDVWWQKLFIADPYLLEGWVIKDVSWAPIVYEDPSSIEVGYRQAR